MVTVVLLNVALMKAMPTVTLRRVLRFVVLVLATAMFESDFYVSMVLNGWYE